MYETKTRSLSFLTTKNTERCITHLVALFLFINAQSLDRELRGYIYEVNYIWMTLDLRRNCVTTEVDFYTFGDGKTSSTTLLTYLLRISV
jgi:hypothetical protein